MRALHLLVMSLLPLASPAGAVPAASSGAVFHNPARYVGRAVRICGYLLGTANITLHRHDQSAGLSIAGHHGRQLVRLGDYAHVCLSGTVIYIGCGSDPNFICTDAAFDYAIDVREVG